MNHPSAAKKEYLGHIPSRYSDEISWRMPTSDEATKLHLGPGIPIARVLRTSFDQNDRAIEVYAVVLPGDRARPPVRRGRLMNLRPIVLKGDRVRLEPLAYSHADELVQAAAYDEIWTYLDEPTPHKLSDIEALITDALTEQEKGARLPFAIINTHTNQAVGSTSYIDIRPTDRTLEIG